MVQSLANTTVKYKFILITDDNCFAELDLPRKDLEPAKKMTALLYVRDYLKDQVGLKEAQLMFDGELETTEEKMLRQGITQVSLKPKSLADQIGMKAPDAIEDKVSAFIVND